MRKSTASEGSGGRDREIVLDQLQQLGMTGYEAKAYTALIAAGSPLTGYEVAKRSDVPRSTVYETLGKLRSRGAAFEVKLNGSAAYLPLPVDALLDRLRREFDDAKQRLMDALPSVVHPPATRMIHHLTGQEPVLDRAGEMIAAAVNSLYLALWDREAAQLEKAIEEAEARGVAVFLLTFGQGEAAKHAFRHRLVTAPGDPRPIDRRLLVVAADRSSVLIGGISQEDMRAIYSDDPAVTLLAIEYIRHDIALQQLSLHIGVEKIEKVWNTDEALRRLAAQTGLPGAGPSIST